MSKPHQPLPILISTFAICVLLAGTYRALLLTFADWHFRDGDLKGIESAERILPSNARYHFARALALQQEDPASRDVDRELSRAVALNPRFSDAMLSWSVDKEFSGDKRGAEKLLMEARSVDRELRPSWALANFYYRQGDSAHFWPEARECLKLISVAGYTSGRYDPASIFQLCWRMQSDASKILDEAIPPSPQLEQIYLNYLIFKRDIDAQVGLVERVLPHVTADYLWVLIPHLSALLNAGKIETAVNEWNILITRKILPYELLDPAKGLSLTDASFLWGPSGVGFDWRTLYPDPVRFSYLEAEHSYRFEFDGTQPEKVDLLSEVVPVLPNRTYRYSSKYRAPFDAEASGVRWVVNINGSLIPLRVVKVSGQYEQIVVLEFATPSQAKAANLLLGYSRSPGTTRVQGPFELAQVSLTLQ